MPFCATTVSPSASVTTWACTDWRSMLRGPGELAVLRPFSCRSRLPSRGSSDCFGAIKSELQMSPKGRLPPTRTAADRLHSSWSWPARVRALATGYPTAALLRSTEPREDLHCPQRCASRSLRPLPAPSRAESLAVHIASDVSTRYRHRSRYAGSACAWPASTRASAARPSVRRATAQRQPNGGSHDLAAVRFRFDIACNVAALASACPPAVLSKMHHCSAPALDCPRISSARAFSQDEL